MRAAVLLITYATTGGILQVSMYLCMYYVCKCVICDT